MTPLLQQLLRWARARGRNRVVWGAAIALVVVASYPLWGGWLGARIAASVLSRRLGVVVSIGGGRAGWGDLKLEDVVVGTGQGGRTPLLSAPSVRVPLGAAFGSGTILVDMPRMHIERGGDRDNVAPVIAKLAGARAGTAPGKTDSRRPLPQVVVSHGTLRLRDAATGASVLIGELDAALVPGQRVTVRTKSISGSVRLRGGDKDPSFGAAAVEVDAALAGLRPAFFPAFTVDGGYLRPSPTLSLTGISGTIGSDPAAPEHIAVDLAGSYGGAKKTLWTATGSINLNGRLEGVVSVTAERFTLDKIADVLPASVLLPQQTAIDAALRLVLKEGRISFSGSLDVDGLNLRHDGLASEPLSGLSFALRTEGAVDPARRRLEVAKLEGRLHDLVGRLNGSVELAPGVFRYPDGTELPTLPKVDFSLQVPRVACAKLLASIPGPVVPHLQGFELQGFFEADIRSKIDYASLDALELGGKVGIDGCKVKTAPEEVAMLAAPADSIVQTVEVPAGPEAEPGTVELMAFALGPDNPDFVPYEKISPHVINAIMTTEDSGFFRHRGWVSSEFKTALRRNLAGGGFRLGASSITMQMVKNVLLSHEKTLSRKLQELFLVWYIEQQLPKERILELYFNAIEFGPRIYGIGAAARHYFGKSASDLTPLEAAFFSSMLPSPKRRYIQYCHGALYPPWDRYVRKIMTRVHERGRMTDEEFAAASSASLTFDLTERTLPEKQCLEWVKRITQRPEPELAPENDTP